MSVSVDHATRCDRTWHYSSIHAWSIWALYGYSRHRLVLSAVIGVPSAATSTLWRVPAKSGCPGLHLYCAPVHPPHSSSVRPFSSMQGSTHHDSQAFVSGRVSETGTEGGHGGAASAEAALDGAEHWRLQCRSMNAALSSRPQKPSLTSSAQRAGSWPCDAPTTKSRPDASIVHKHTVMIGARTKH